MIKKEKKKRTQVHKTKKEHNYTKKYVYELVDLPTSKSTIESANNAVFLLCETSTLDIRPEIIQPSQPTTLAATFKA